MQRPRLVDPAPQRRPPPPRPDIVLARLRRAYGTFQDWWPIDHAYHATHGTDWRFEVCVGAVLTQNTAWRNVGPALQNLKSRGWLDPRGLAAARRARLASAIRPAGFQHQKARYLRSLAQAVMSHPGGLDAWFARPTAALRRRLLEIDGIGPETADAILVYAARRPVFVADAYARRLAVRLGLAGKGASYDPLQEIWTPGCGPSCAGFARAHALIVEHAKHRCTARAPRCVGCPLRDVCPRNGVVGLAPG